MRSKAPEVSKNGLSRVPKALKPWVRHKGLVFMLIPCVLFFLIFHYTPMYGITIAFKDYRALDGILGSKWVGFEHFQNLFSGVEFPRVLWNTLFLSICRLIVGFPAPIILALLLNEVRSSKYKKLVQTTTYLPYFFSWVVLGGILRMLLAYKGPVNGIIEGLGGTAIGFLSDDFWYIITYLLASMWHGAGYNAVIYLAALSGIDMDLYEAAMVDGAGRWKQLLHITLPCLIPTIVTMFILGLGGILNAGFDQIYNTYNPLVYDVADILDTYVLRKLRTLDYSLGTAAGLFKSAVGAVLVFGSNWFARKISDNEYGLW